MNETNRRVYLFPVAMKKLFYAVLLAAVLVTVVSLVKTYSEAKADMQAEELAKQELMQQQLEDYLEGKEVIQMKEVKSFINPGKVVYVVEFAHNVDFATKHVLYYDQKSFEDEPSWHNYSFHNMEEEERLYYAAYLQD